MTIVRCSDFTETGKEKLAKSLVPSYHTRDHCILIPSSHIPSVGMMV